ncbi:MAG: hypothetical protein WKG01_14770 [Kofleriaceae bacterium]
MRAAILAVVGLLACGDTAQPAPTEAVCPDPGMPTLTYESFGAQFMADYCTSCHARSLPRSQRNGAPLYHDFDTLPGVIQVANHIEQQAGVGPAASNDFMPPARCSSTPGGPLDIDCPQPTEAERRQLAQWIACEVERAAAR